MRISIDSTCLFHLNIIMMITDHTHHGENLTPNDRLKLYEYEYVPGTYCSISSSGNAKSNASVRFHGPVGQVLVTGLAVNQRISSRSEIFRICEHSSFPYFTFTLRSMKDQ